MSQLELLDETEWDNLLILDACRYDAFEKFYPRYLKGELTKTQALSSCTETWLAKNWRGYYDLTYVSGNPYVNSAGVPIRKYDNDKGGIMNNYIAKDHFKRVIDVWDFGWDTQLNTVPPKAMNDAILKLTSRTDLVAHYVQPHWPYIGKTRVITGSGQRLRANVRRNFYPTKPLEKYTPQGTPKNPQFVAQNRRAYEDNLKLVLSWVAIVTPHLKGTTIISADHGELLGESNLFNHPCFFDHPLLRTVPWFKVQS